MRGKKLLITFLSILMSIGFLCKSYAAPMKEIQLPKPQTNGGIPLMQALMLRKSERLFSDRKLPAQVLSNLLWAACGINRPESGKRTAPTAVNWQEMDVYVAMAEGVYLYDPQNRTLRLVIEGDLRAKTGMQAYVKDAPINLIYVADLSRAKSFFSKDKEFYATTVAGFISQNVYLFCASENLATVVRGWIDKDGLKKAMKLKPEQKIILAQSVGYPKE